MARSREGIPELRALAAEDRAINNSAIKIRDAKEVSVDRLNGWEVDLRDGLGYIHDLS